MKSGSDSKKPPKLRRTLKRKPVIQPLDEEGLKYLWVAYKKGLFPLEEGLSPIEFNEQAAEFLLANYDSAWLLGEKPFGIVYGQAVGPMMMLGGTTWFPWASPRNKLEGLTMLFNELRKTAKILLYCSIEEKRFYEHIAKHGILRRVGHIHDIEEGPSVLWESKPVIKRDD